MNNDNVHARQAEAISLAEHETWFFSSPRHLDPARSRHYGIHHAPLLSSQPLMRSYSDMSPPVAAQLTRICPSARLCVMLALSGLICELFLEQGLP
jgi:hypothetical protein